MKKTVLLLALLHHFCLAQTQGFPAANSVATGTPSPLYYPTCIVTSPFVNSDRAAAWASLLEGSSSLGKQIGGNSYFCVDARGDTSLEGSTGTLTTMSNPFPINPLLGGTGTGVGGTLLLPPGVIQLSAPWNLGDNQIQVYGIGDGSPAGSGGPPTGTFGAPTVLDAQSAITGASPGLNGTGASKTYNPAMFAFGAIAARQQNGLGPYRSKMGDLTIDCENEPLIGLSWYSGQEGTEGKNLSILDCPTVGLDWGATNSIGDGAKIHDFTVTHSGTTTGKASCQSTTTAIGAGTLSWKSYTGGIIVFTYTNSPNPLPQPGFQVTISGASGGSSILASTINGTYEIAAVPASGLPNPGNWVNQRLCPVSTTFPGCNAPNNLFTSSSQFAVVVNTNISGDSSAHTQGTATMYTTQMRMNGFSGRRMGEVTLDSINCTSQALADLMVSGANASGVIEGVHNEGNGTPIVIISVNNPGTNYSPGDILTVQQAGGLNGTATVLTTSPTTPGPIHTIQLTNGGLGYSNGTGLQTGTNGLGSNATVNITVSTILMYGLTIGWDAPTSGWKFDNIQASNGINTGVLISPQWGTPTNIQLHQVVSLVPLQKVTTLEDDANGNIFTADVNPIINFYDLDESGTPWTDANCSQMTKGWCGSGGDFAYYSGGVKQVDMNGSTGVINAGTGLTFGTPGTAPNGATVSCNGTVCAPTLPGFTGRSVTVGTDTILPGDNGQPVYYQGSTAVAVTLPAPTGLGNANFYTKLVNNLSTNNNVSVSASPWTIRGSPSSFNISEGQACKFSVNPNTGVTDDWIAECHDEPISAGTNITITRGQFGPTITAAGSGTVGANSTSFPNEVAVYNNNSGSTTVNPASSNPNPDIATINGNNVGRALSGTGCTVGQQSAVSVSTGDTVFYNCAIPADLYNSGHSFGIYIVYKPSASSTFTIKAWLGQTAILGHNVTSGVQVGGTWTQSSTVNASDHLDCILTSSTAGTCYGDMSLLANSLPLSAGSVGGGPSFSALSGLTTGVATNVSFSFAAASGTTMQVQLARVVVY